MKFLLLTASTARTLGILFVILFVFTTASQSIAGNKNLQSSLSSMDSNRLANAIYKVEGGSKTRWPYGIQIKNGGKGFKKFTPQQARIICLRTISSNSHLTLEEFAKVYCPPNAVQWSRNVRRIYGTMGQRNK